MRPAEKLEAVTALPCPFCAGVRLKLGEAQASTRLGELKHWIYCTTEGCGASGPFSDTKYEAVQKWNVAPRRKT